MNQNHYFLKEFIYELKILFLKDFFYDLKYKNPIYVLIPLLTNACGGIFVGQVTKHAGSVRKIFCVV